jgi:hypothetical protein
MSQTWRAYHIVDFTQLALTELELSYYLLSNALDAFLHKKVEFFNIIRRQQ